MPAISLVVCLCGERDMFERMLQHAQECYDELLVIHDGPDVSGIREIAETAGGRFIERPRLYQQEPHWPFAYGEAKYDWILRLDADEFFSPELRTWLIEFRKAPEPAPSVTGYICIEPNWNGKKVVSPGWPQNRYFFFNRNRVSLIGMAECTPLPDPGTSFQKIDLEINHRPPFPRKTYGFANIFLRKRTWDWSRQIAINLMGSPLDLPCWRWNDPHWPPFWEKMRRSPLKTGFFGGLRMMLIFFLQCIKKGRWPHPAYWLFPHHIQFGLVIAWEKWRQRHRRKVS